MIHKDSNKEANLNALRFMAIKLQELRNEVVFLGGCTTVLFITEKGVPDIRYTYDVDCIIDVISLPKYHQFESKLSKLGFKRSIQEDVICRWFYDDMILDVMPTDENILGFSNKWYKQAIKNCMVYDLQDDLPIQIVTAPYFLATKLEAFKTRGNMDFFVSCDFEDIVSILDGRIEIVDEILNTDKEVKEYLQNSFSKIQKAKSFADALPGHLVQYGDLANDRIELIFDKIDQLVGE